MSKVVFDISMSLDGFVTAANVTADEPMGRGGQRLHEWAFNHDARNEEILENAIGAAGAFIAGRRTYDAAAPWWGADGPTGPARLPLLVVTHRAPDRVPQGGVYTFITDGVASAVQQAKDIAGDKTVAIMSADIGRQGLAAGLVDEVSVHLVPVLFGDGTRLLEHPGAEHIQLDTPTVTETRDVTHLSYRIRTQPT